MIIQRVVTNAGHTLRPMNIPFIRSLEMMKTGELDIMQLIFYTDERTEYIHYLPVPIVYEKITLFKLRDNDLPHTFPIENFENYTVGKVLGKSYGPYWDNMEMNSYEVPDEENYISMLILGRIDYLIGDYTQTLYLAEQMGVRNQLVAVEGAGIANPNYIGVSRQNTNHHEIVEDLTRALMDFKETTEYEDILNAYNLYPGE